MGSKQNSHRRPLRGLTPFRLARGQNRTKPLGIPSLARRPLHLSYLEVLGLAWDIPPSGLTGFPVVRRPENPEGHLLPIGCKVLGDECQLAGHAYRLLLVTPEGPGRHPIKHTSEDKKTATTREAPISEINDLQYRMPFPAKSLCRHRPDTSRPRRPVVGRKKPRLLSLCPRRSLRCPCGSLARL